MKKHLLTAWLYTVVTAVLFGLVYPLFITGIAHIFMRDKADGQIVSRNGEEIGSALIGQPFTGPDYFHSRPSNAGTGYDASASSGSNYGPTNKKLLDRVDSSLKDESTGAAVPIDLVTASGSGLDPDITPAAAFYQVHRVAQRHHLADTAVEELVRKNITTRQFGLLGEPRINILNLNLALRKLVDQRQQPGALLENR